MGRRGEGGGEEGSGGGDKGEPEIFHDSFRCTRYYYFFLVFLRDDEGFDLTWMVFSSMRWNEKKRGVPARQRARPE